MVTAAKIPSPARMLDGLPPDTRVVIADVPWEFYDQFSDADDERRNLRMAYDGRDIELMTMGPYHHMIVGILSGFISAVAEELRINNIGVGATTWKRPQIQRGIEADLSYYFDPAKITAAAASFARWSNDVADYPDADLAIEVDVSPSRLNRPGIYAALKVREFWRIQRDRVSIGQLSPGGAYEPAASGLLRLRAEDVQRWIFAEDWDGGIEWRNRLRDWLRAEFA